MANFYHHFLKSVRQWPEGIAVEVAHQDPSQPSERYSFTDMRNMSEGFAQWMVQIIGDAGGAQCALLAANGPRWVAAFLGTLAAGNVVVPLDTALNVEQVRKLLKASNSCLLLVDEKHREIGEQAAEGSGVRLAFLEEVIQFAEIAGRGPHVSGHDFSRAEIVPDCFSALAAEATAPPSAAKAALQKSALTARLKSCPDTFVTTPNSVDSEGMGQEARAEFAPREVASDSTAAILYSSGTTGDPKGVMLTHDNLLAETDSIFAVVDIGPHDSFLGILPLFHAFALVVNLLLPMAGGSRVVFLESLNTADLIRALPSVNIFACVPQFFYLIHERIWKQVNERGKAAATIFRLLLRLSRMGRKVGLNPGRLFFGRIHALLGPKMRYLATGGSRFDAAIGREFEALGFTLLQGYGLTETTGAATYTPPGAVDIATVGRPLPGLEVRIRDARVLEGQEGPAVGEVLLRGRIVMKGYYGRPEATAEILKDGWLHTGDLGYIDAHGNLKLTGRAKEIIVPSSGKNVYPEEIEAHYLKSPLIKEICVLGLESAPGEPRAERLHGVVVPNFEELKVQKIVNSREALRYAIENLSVQLPSTKRLLSYELRQDELPRTTTRKIKRFEVERQVRQRIATGQGELGEPASIRRFSADDRTWLAQPEVERALKIIRSAIKIPKEEIHPADNLELDLGLDSMERVELLVALERELGGAVEDAAIAHVYTVRELVQVVREHKHSPGQRVATPAWDEVLRQQPDDPALLGVARSTPVTAFWFVATRLAKVLARGLFRLRVEGLEKLPKSGPFILAPNHQSFLDPPLLVSVLPWSVFRDTFYVGASEIFGEGLWRAVARSLKLIPVDADANLVPAMQAAAYGLRHNQVLVLFPEGERSIDGVPRVFKKGAAILAAHLQVPIVPVAIDGAYESWPRNRKFQKFAPIRIAFGDPILPSQERSPEQEYEALTETMHKRVRGMWEKLHRELHAVDVKF